MTMTHTKQRKRLATVIAGLIALFSVSTVRAEPSIPVVPGKYKIVNDIVDKETSNCFKEDRLSAEVIRAQMKAEGDSGQCEIVDSSRDGDQLILGLACQYSATEKGTGTMRISTSTSDETVTVKSTFRTTVEGQERSMDMTSVGKRIGGC